MPWIPNRQTTSAKREAEQHRVDDQPGRGQRHTGEPRHGAREEHETRDGQRGGRQRDQVAGCGVGAVRAAAGAHRREVQQLARSPDRHRRRHPAAVRRHPSAPRGRQRPEQRRGRERQGTGQAERDGPGVRRVRHREHDDERRGHDGDRRRGEEPRVPRPTPALRIRHATAPGSPWRRHRGRCLGSAPDVYPFTSSAGANRERTSSLTLAASACPRMSLITAPTSAPAAATLPAADLLRDRRVGRDRGIDGRPERGVVRHEPQAAVGDHLLRLALPRQHAVEGLAGQGVGEGALLDQPRQGGDLGGGDRQRGQLDALARSPGGPARPSTTCARPPASRPPRRSRRPGRGRRRSRRPAARGRCSPTRPGAGAGAARAARAGSPAAPRPRRGSGAIGTRSGSGKYR